MIAFENEYFIVEHAYSCFVPGYLVLAPKTKVNHIYELDKAALFQFGETVAVIHQAINKVIQPERIYTLSFSEESPILHFHILPRTLALLQDYQNKNKLQSELIHGPLLFNWCREEYKSKPFGNYEKIVVNLNAEFSKI